MGSCPCSVGYLDVQKSESGVRAQGLAREKLRQNDTLAPNPFQSSQPTASAFLENSSFATSIATTERPRPANISRQPPEISQNECVWNPFLRKTANFRRNLYILDQKRLTECYSQGYLQLRKAPQQDARSVQTLRYVDWGREGNRRTTGAVCADGRFLRLQAAAPSTFKRRPAPTAVTRALASGSVRLE